MTVPFYVKDKTKVIDTVNHYCYIMQSSSDAQTLCNILNNYHKNSAPNIQKQFTEILMSFEILSHDIENLKGELL